MDSGRDRLSELHDDLILKILSFVDLKDAIGTGVLSPRWRYLWTSIPRLSFSSDDFCTMDKFFDFVTHALSRRNNQTQLSSFKLYVRGKDGQNVVRRIMNHAFSLNAQQVNITCVFKDYSIFFPNNIGFPFSLSSSHTLKHLTLTWDSTCDHIILTSTPKFSSLTTLHLGHITLPDGFLSMCPNLENLTLNCCKITGSNIIRICHPRLSNLTLEDGHYGTLRVDLVTPKLKNLAILNCYGGYEISAPELASLVIKGFCPSMFSADALYSLEEAQLSLHTLCGLKIPTIISLLQKFYNVKLLSLNMEIIQLLNASHRQISRQPSPLANLKTLKILPKMFCYSKHTHTRVIVSTEVKNYLLNGSPKATLTEVLREQCCDITASDNPDFWWLP